MDSWKALELSRSDTVAADIPCLSACFTFSFVMILFTLVKKLINASASPLDFNMHISNSRIWLVVCIACVLVPLYGNQQCGHLWKGNWISSFGYSNSATLLQLNKKQYLHAPFLANLNSVIY